MKQLANSDVQAGQGGGAGGANSQGQAGQGVGSKGGRGRRASTSHLYQIGNCKFLRKGTRNENFEDSY